MLKLVTKWTSAWSPIKSKLFFSNLIKFGLSLNLFQSKISKPVINNLFHCRYLNLFAWMNLCHLDSRTLKIYLCPKTYQSVVFWSQITKTLFGIIRCIQMTCNTGIYSFSFYIFFLPLFFSSSFLIVRKKKKKKIREFRGEKKKRKINQNVRHAT